MQPSFGGALAQQVSLGDRRAEVRFATNTQAKMRILSPAATTELIDVKVVDSSMSGIRVSTGMKVEVGMVVEVNVHLTVMVAEIRNCTPTQDGFEAGLHISAFHDPSNS